MMFCIGLDGLFHVMAFIYQHHFIFFSAALTCPPINRYRTFDGSCNNLNNPTWGQAGTVQRRFTDQTGNPMVEYEDGMS